jgi:hypothetical protein
VCASLDSRCSTRLSSLSSHAAGIPLLINPTTPGHAQRERYEASTYSVLRNGLIHAVCGWCRERPKSTHNSFAQHVIDDQGVP